MESKVLVVQTVLGCGVAIPFHVSDTCYVQTEGFVVGKRLHHYEVCPDLSLKGFGDILRYVCKGDHVRFGLRSLDLTDNQRELCTRREVEFAIVAFEDRACMRLSCCQRSDTMYYYPEIRTLLCPMLPSARGLQRRRCFGFETYTCSRSCILLVTSGMKTPLGNL